MSEKEPSPAPSEKEKKQKKGVWRLYESKEGASKRSSRFCPRCGPGFFMANHEDRYTCGKCHYTEFKKVETPAKSRRLSEQHSPGQRSPAPKSSSSSP